MTEKTDEHDVNKEEEAHLPTPSLQRNVFVLPTANESKVNSNSSSKSNIHISFLDIYFHEPPVEHVPVHLPLVRQYSLQITPCATNINQSINHNDTGSTRLTYLVS